MLILLVQVYEVFITSNLGKRGSKDIAKFMCSFRSLEQYMPTVLSFSLFLSSRGTLLSIVREHLNANYLLLLKDRFCEFN